MIRMILLVHHGPAVGPEIDPMRPLSSVGRAATERLAAAVAQRGVQPHAIWHSGKLRARQTAELFWKACNPLASFSAERGLQPGDPPRRNTRRGASGHGEKQEGVKPLRWAALYSNMVTRNG